MGSAADLMIVGGDGAALVEWAVARLAALEASWSRFLPESELRSLDGCAGGGAAASPDLIDAVGRALSLWYVTNGLFDPTVRRALEAIGYDRTFRDVIPTGPEIAAASPPVPGCAGLRVDRERSTLTIPAGVALDLGGIGKGLAADLVATGLIERGATGACVGLGGDVRVAGSPVEGEAWPIRVEHPFDDVGTLTTRRLRDESIVTSTTRFRRWTRGTRTMHHIIDPATGEPADRGVVAVVAQADEAWWAEGVAKAALVAGVDAGLELLERLGVAATVFDTSGRCHPTTRWADS
jgi:thiamine biosynthesis lipoprotein